MQGKSELDVGLELAVLLHGSAAAAKALGMSGKEGVDDYCCSSSMAMEQSQVARVRCWSLTHTNSAYSNWLAYHLNYSLYVT